MKMVLTLKQMEYQFLETIKIKPHLLQLPPTPFISAHDIIYRMKNVV